MKPIDLKYLELTLVDSLTSEQKRCILSLVLQQPITFNGSDFVIGPENGNSSSLPAKTIDMFFHDFIEQRANDGLISFDLKEFLTLQIDEILSSKIKE